VTEVLRSTAAKKRVVRTAPPRSVPRSWVIMKRAIDILVSLLVLIVTSPVLLAAVIGITIVSGGSPIFTQERIGRDGRCFRMFKLRTSIDELPNFLNVLRGEMAAVGPRPPLPSEVADYDEYALRRLSVKPGVTCLWQISGRSEISFDQWMALDNAYIDSWSPALDVLIIARTIPAVLRGIGAH
jgi:lipopolysaccharide/colanic/teichoic acid biosynthesis glycosyltransferase